MSEIYERNKFFRLNTKLSPAIYNYLHDLAFMFKLLCKTLFRHSTGENVHNQNNKPMKYRKCYAPGGVGGRGGLSYEKDGGACRTF